MMEIVLPLHSIHTTSCCYCDEQQWSRDEQSALCSADISIVIIRQKIGGGFYDYMVVVEYKLETHHQQEINSSQSASASAFSPF